ncbi:MAG: DDE-type integrase/transposase/recombinase [Ktedonobacteraceae bacterium]
MDIDSRTKKALFRLEVIAPLVSGRLSKRELELERKRVLERIYTTPDGKEWQVSARTLRDWVRRHKQKGFVGLFDTDRGTHGRSRAISEDVLKEAMTLRKQEKSLSIPQIMELLKYSEPLQGRADELKRVSASTLNRQLKKRGAIKNKSREEVGSFQRWQQKFVNDMWTADTADGIWIPDPANPKQFKKTYFISFVDDASRVVPHAQFYFDTKLPSLLDCFKKALQKRAKPGRLYADNAWIYHSTTMRLLCAELDIKPSFCTPKRPPGKGKIERKIRTVEEGFYNIAEHAGIKTLDELNQFFFAWLTSKYHKVVHSELDGLTPMQRWLVDKERLVRVTPLEVRRGLMLRCQRRVDRKTATVRLDRSKYQANIALAGEKVEVRYHFDDPAEIEIWQRGKMIEVAKPVIVGPNIDFSKRPSKREADGDERGKTYPAFEAYRKAITGKRAPEPSLARRDSQLITQEEFIGLFRELLARELSPTEEELLVKFFLKYAPFNKTTARDKLEQTIAVAGSHLHLRAYCERMLDAVAQTRR